LILLDILGFRELVATRSAEEVYRTIDDALAYSHYWERMNGEFSTIYFSDTLIFYQRVAGYGHWAFLDAYALAGFLYCAIVAKGIPVRGAVSFGGFTVRLDSSGLHEVYFGDALVEAYDAQGQENWVGISICRSAWEPFARDDSAAFEAFGKEGVWRRRADDVLLLNPFSKLRAYHPSYLLGEVPRPYANWDAPDFPNELKALQFLHDKAEQFEVAGDRSRVAMKYRRTVKFLRKVFPDVYAWALQASQEINLLSSQGKNSSLK